MSKKEKIGIILLVWAAFVNQPLDGSNLMLTVKIITFLFYMAGLFLLMFGGDN